MPLLRERNNVRQIFLDTETTGLYPDQGHKIIEIGAVEMINRRLTHHNYHQYLKPEREIDLAAQEVHGITLEFLADKPIFEQVAEEFIAFITDAELIIHNAPFDIGFLNAELSHIGLQPVEAYCHSITDTLVMAKEMRPGQRNNLDALCRNFGIDNTTRTLHGALLDSELLADVYIAMTRGQESLLMDLEQSNEVQHVVNMSDDHNKPAIKVLKASQEELELHQNYMNSLK